ncbi:MAG: ABC transporter permease [Gemmatimonadota bacterium]
MIGRVWALEWRIALTRRRLFAWNVIVPVALLLPVAASPAAAPHRAAVFSVFIVFFATFGSCIPLVREGASGWVEKVRLTGYGERAWLAERTIAAAALDALQLLPLLLILLAVSGASWAPGLGAAAGLLLALLFGNLLGSVIAALVRSLAEGALACAAASLFALHLSGVFRAAGPGTWAETVEHLSPFGPLHDGLLAVSAGSPAVTRALTGTGGVGPLASWIGPIAVVLLGAGLVLAAAPTLARRLAGAAA